MNFAETGTSTILVVDDEPALRMAFGDLLTAEGYDLILASSGMEGLEKATELIPDLILLDVKMPDMDGFEVCRRLRADPLLSDVPIIMVTALADRQSRLRGFEAGADDFVSKPVDNIELLARVRTTAQLNRFRHLLLEQTRRQQAEEALQESEARYRGLFEGMPVGLYRTTPGGHFLAANPALVEMLGYPEPEPLLAVNVIDLFVNREERQRWAALIEQNGLVRDFETQVRRHDGTIIWVKDTARVIRDSQGQTHYYEGSIEDITERIHAEEALKHRHEELAALHAIASAASRSLSLDEMLYAALEETLAVLDVAGGVICLLDEASKTLVPVVHRGFSPAMLDEFADFKVGEGLLGRVAQTGEPLSVSDLAQDSEGLYSTLVREDWHSLVSAPLKAQDRTVGAIALIDQGRDRFSLENVDLLTAIGHQVGVAVDNARLAEEAAEAEILHELNRLRSELIANVSHELRTPLGLIKVFCTTLLRKDVEFDHETQREFLQDIDEETERLEKIVDDLLDLSRMESGRLRLDKRPTDFGQLIREVIEAMGTSVQPVQHRFAYNLPADPLVAIVDPKHIEQVLRNLLGNAIKYSPEGGMVTIGGRGDGRQILIWVSDEGMGIPTQDLERIFERFYRVENEVTMNVRGAGLGLSVCRGIVEAHGGRIWAESALGEGSTFYFALPVDGEETNARREDPHSSSG
jgi:PAS domain S-box-containing protein